MTLPLSIIVSFDPVAPLQAGSSHFAHEEIEEQSGEVTHLVLKLK